MKKYQNVLYFLNGSIGDFLMVLFLMENLHKNNPFYKLYICTPRNPEIFAQLLLSYPYIQMVHLNRKSAVSILSRFLLRRNCCITPPTPGRIPFFTKIFARILSFRGMFVGFDDGARVNRFFYTRMIALDLTRLYCDLILDVLRVFGFERRFTVPTLKFQLVEGILKRLNVQEHMYIVLHPFGSALQRSILGDDLVYLISHIQRISPDSTILISGSGEDTKKIPSHIQSEVMVVAGKLTLIELATLIQHARLYVGVDTGITHLASVLGIRSLVIAHNGAPNWLPYYNKCATILYQIKDDTSNIHEGRAYLESQRNSRSQYLDRVSKEVIVTSLEKILLTST